MAGDELVPILSRRQFLGALASSALVPADASCIAVADVSSLTAEGQSIVLRERGPDGAPILVVRRSAKRFTALSMQCTHEGCPVAPPVNGIIICPCHGSRYDLSGAVTHGPAQFALARYRVQYDADARRLCVKK